MHFSNTWLVYYKGNVVYCSVMTFPSLLSKKYATISLFLLAYIPRVGLVLMGGLGGVRGVMRHHILGQWKEIRIKLFPHLSLPMGCDTPRATSPFRLASKTSRGRTREQEANPLLACYSTSLNVPQMKSMLGRYGRYAEFIFEGTGSTVFRFFPRI